MTVGQEVKHRRKRRRGRIVGDGIELRSGHVTTDISGYWRPWHGHAQLSRERTPEQINRKRRGRR